MSQYGKNINCSAVVIADEATSSPEITSMCRLLETNATDSCSASNYPNQMPDDNCTFNTTITTNILGNIVASISDLWNLKDKVSSALLEKLPKDGNI